MPCLWVCRGLTLAGCQVPTKASLPLPSSAGQERENTTKGSWVRIRTGRDHPLLSQAKQTQLGEINWISYQSNQNRNIRNKTNFLNTFFPPLSLLEHDLILNSWPPIPKQHGEIGNQSCGQVITCYPCHSFLLCWEDYSHFSPFPAWAPLSTGPQVRPGACYSTGFQWDPVE